MQGDLRFDRGCRLRFGAAGVSTSPSSHANATTRFSHERPYLDRRLEAVHAALVAWKVWGGSGVTVAARGRLLLAGRVAGGYSAVGDDGGDLVSEGGRRLARSLGVFLRTGLQYCWGNS